MALPCFSTLVMIFSLEPHFVGHSVIRVFSGSVSSLYATIIAAFLFQLWKAASCTVPLPITYQWQLCSLHHI